jgi:hypothetical protein
VPSSEGAARADGTASAVKDHPRHVTGSAALPYGSAHSHLGIVRATMPDEAGPVIQVRPPASGRSGHGHDGLGARACGPARVPDRAMLPVRHPSLAPGTKRAHPTPRTGPRPTAIRFAHRQPRSTSRSWRSSTAGSRCRALRDGASSSSPPSSSGPAVAHTSRPRAPACSSRRSASRREPRLTCNRLAGVRSAGSALCPVGRARTGCWPGSAPLLRRTTLAVRRPGMPHLVEPLRWPSGFSGLGRQSRHWSCGWTKRAHQATEHAGGAAIRSAVARRHRVPAKACSSRLTSGPVGV